MSIEDRDWFRNDYEKRRKIIEEQEKKKARQIGADAMWNEVERQRPQSINNPQRLNKQPERYVEREKQLLLTCPNCERQFSFRIKSKRISSNSCRCPNCNRRITIKCETSTDKVITTVLYIIGIPAVLLVAYSLVDSILHALIG